MEEYKYITKSQQYYLNICEFMGVKIFKKYWHIKGRFDNNFKLDKNNKFHLDTVIRDSNNFTNEHKSGYFAEILMFQLPIISYGLHDKIKNKNNSLLLFGISVAFCSSLYHGYALMVHKYNRIKANARIQFLEEKEKINKTNEDTYNEDLDEDKLICIRRYYNKNYKLYIKEADLYINFIFLDKKQAISFRQYIYNNIENITLEKLFQIYNLNKFKDLYKQFIQKI